MTKTNPILTVLALWHGLKRRITRGTAKRATARLPAVPDYLRKDIGLPEPHRPERSQAPPRIDPVRHI